MSQRWALALHGGAGPVFGRDYSAEEAHMAATLKEGARQLARGATALDVVESIAVEMEKSGLYLAGKGSSPNTSGVYELDAAIMDGRTRNAGAVACLEGYESPIKAARLVMEKTPNVMLAGAGAAQFAKTAGLAHIGDPDNYYTPVQSRTVQIGAPSFGTIGAVALDIYGDLATATSTGGITSKTPGRVGDAPLIGAGTWADERVAISCTGLGEYFIRANAAADVSARLLYGGQSATDAVQGALDDVRRLGGEGGIIAVTAAGQLVALFNSGGMKRALADSAGRYEVAVFQ